jgi:peptide/nickel transport system substrate-binding protein
MRSHTARSRRLVAAAAGLTLAAGFVTGCAATQADDDATSIRIGVYPSSLSGNYDPATAFIYALDTSAVYESLFLRDPRTSEPEPNLAVSYEISEDRRSVTFELRDDVRFVGGTPMTAEAVAEFFTLLSRDEESGPYAIFTEHEATFAATGETTLEVTASKAVDAPNGLFEWLGGTPIADPASMADREAAAASPQGTGPYLVEEFVPEVSATLVRNPDYWDPNSALYPYDEVEILVFDDDVARLNALKSGQIDAAPLGLNLAGEADDAGLTAHLSAGGRFTALWIADRAGAHVPALADQRVRQAIALAFDRETINETLNYGFGIVTSQPGIETSGVYVPDGDERYGYDPERARELLAEAGYAGGFDITIPTTTFLGINEWAPVVQQSLADIGIRVSYEDFADVSAYFGAAVSGDYPVILFRDDPGAGNVIRVFVGPDAVFNHPRYEDPVVAELWETIRTGTSDEAVEAQAELGAYTLDQAWLAVITNSKYLWMSQDGFPVNVDTSGFPQLLSFGRAE